MIGSANQTIDIVNNPYFKIKSYELIDDGKLMET